MFGIKTQLFKKYLIFIRIYYQTMAKLYCETNLQNSVFSPLSNTHQRILFLQGTSQEIQNQIEEYLRLGGINTFQSLRIDIKGTLLKSQNCCLFASTIIAASICLLPVFAICTDCWKQKTNKIKEVKEGTYRSITRLLKMGNFVEFFLMVDDNLLSEAKVEVLIDGVRGRVRNLVLINKAKSFNVVADNYSKSKRYFRRLVHQVHYGECRWDKDVLTNIPRD